MAERKTERRIDSWKTKRKYKILAPENFESKEMGILIASDPKNLIGRKVTYSLRDITGDKQKQHLNVILRVDKVDGDKAKTVFDSFEVNRKYIISKVHTGSKVMDHVENTEIKDYKIRVKTIITTANDVQRSKQKDIIKTISETLKSYKDMNLNEFMELVLFGKVNMEIFRRSKKICPLGRVEIRSLKPLELLPQKEAPEVIREAPAPQENTQTQQTPQTPA